MLGGIDRDVLLIDETLATGDEAFRDKCTRTIRSLAEQGRTIIFASHDAALVAKICERCLYLEVGRFLDEGPVDYIVTRYKVRPR